MTVLKAKSVLAVLRFLSFSMAKFSNDLPKSTTEIAEVSMSMNALDQS